MHPSRIFFYACIGFIAGIAAGNFFALSDWLLICLCIVGLMVLAWHGFNTVGISALALVALVAGLAIAVDERTAWDRARAFFLAKALAEPDAIIAVVTRRAYLKNSTYYRIKTDEGTTLALLIANQKPLHIGSIIRIASPIFDTDSKSEPFLKRDGVAGTILFPDTAETMGREQALRHAFWENLALARESFERHLALVLPEPHASLAAGLLTGARTGLPQNLKDDFTRTGLAHIVAVSGYNISILIVAVSTIIGAVALSRGAAFWVGAVFIALFAIFTGAAASVVRASVMGFLVILAQKESRMYSGRVALAFAGTAMLAANPLVLRYDLGFTLSFLATTGLLMLYPLLAERFAHLPKFLDGKDLVLQTISAQLLVLPVIIIAFGNISTVFLAANIAVLPFIPSAMFFSFFGAMAGLAHIGIGRIIALPAYAIISYQISAIKFFSAIPSAAVSLPSSALRWGLGSIAAAFAIWIYYKLKDNSIKS
ncbi:MAG: ComEC/Rec2 family competence protein [bacterium]|nr:ComEC/Rec2 family competence protein [bacterium]